MATGKVLNAANDSSFSFSAGFQSIFSCCFSNDSSGKETGKVQQQTAETNYGRQQTLGSVVLYKARAQEQSGVMGEETDSEGQIVIQGYSDRGSIDGDEFCDSAIDSVSLTSQFNVRGSVDDSETRSGRTAASGEHQQQDSRCRSQNEVAEQDAIMDDSGLNTSEDVACNNSTTRDYKTERELCQGVAGSPDEETGLDVHSPVTSAADDADNDNQSDTIHSETNVIGQCGRIRMTFDYDAGSHRLSVTVHEASDIPEHGRVNLSHSEVHLLLLLHSGKKLRHQTKVKSGDNPRFEDTFRFKVHSDEMPEAELRVRLYRSQTFKRERMIGESYITLSSLHLHNNAPHSFWLTLEPRFSLINSLTTIDASASSGEVTAIYGQSEVASGPVSELMIGLAYNATTGRLAIEVIQGCIRRSASQKPPDTYVKLRLLSIAGKEIARSKTRISHRNPNPSFHETFMFHVSEFQLPDVALMVTVCEHRNFTQNNTIGWFTLGHTNSSKESMSHWKAMIDSAGEQTTRWHNLLKV